MPKGKSTAKDGPKRRREKAEVEVEVEEVEVKLNSRRNLLCFDSGGARSLSSLIVVERLLDELEKDDVGEGDESGGSRRPYEYFDMIGGTGTGGQVIRLFAMAVDTDTLPSLIAIMLGRLKMTIDDCITEFYLILKNVYQDMAPSNHPALGSTDQEERAEAWESFATQNSQKMEVAAKALVKKYGGDEDLMFYDDSESLCEVFVCALVGNTSGLVPLTSYQTLRATKRRLKNIKVWEAIRATTATPTYFDPISIVSEIYTEVLLSGEIGSANPVQMLWNEGKRKFELSDPLIPADPLLPKGHSAEDEEVKAANEPPEDSNRDLSTLISIGSGLPNLYPFETGYHQVMESAFQVVTDHESLADAFQHTNLTVDHSQRYLRLNVLQGLANIEFYDASKAKLGEILRASNNYTEKAEFLKIISRVASINKYRPQRQTFEQVAEQYH